MFYWLLFLSVALVVVANSANRSRAEPSTTTTHILPAMQQRLSKIITYKNAGQPVTCATCSGGETKPIKKTPQRHRHRKCAPACRFQSAKRMALNTQRRYGVGPRAGPVHLGVMVDQRRANHNRNYQQQLSCLFLSYMTAGLQATSLVATIPLLSICITEILALLVVLASLCFLLFRREWC